MTRQQIKTLFLRRVHDTLGVQWSDAEQNDLINLAYAKVQKEIIKVKADAHLFWDYIDTTAGEPWYPMPATFGLRRVGYKSTAGDLSYTKLGPYGYEDLLAQAIGSSNGGYAEMGQWIGIFPTPTEAVDDGIELIHAPIMSLADDAEIPRIKLPLHDAIALWAVLVAKGETDEDGALAKEELKGIIEDLGQWYTANSDTPDRFSIVGA